MTTGASIATTVLSGIVKDEHSCLPVRLQNALHRRYSAPARGQCRRAQAVLERLILALADQQLATGIALLVAGGIKWVEAPGFASGAHASLVVCLSCLSSSSHLAGIINLKGYFRTHRRLGILRIILVAAYAVSLSLALRYIPTAYMDLM